MSCWEPLTSIIIYHPRAHFPALFQAKYVLLPVVTWCHWLAAFRVDVNYINLHQLVICCLPYRFLCLTSGCPADFIMISSNKWINILSISFINIVNQGPQNTSCIYLLLLILFFYLQVILVFMVFGLSCIMLQTKREMHSYPLLLPR